MAEILKDDQRVCVASLSLGESMANLFKDR